jgi:hypothetical protein
VGARHANSVVQPDNSPKVQQVAVYDARGRLVMRLDPARARMHGIAASNAQSWTTRLLPRGGVYFLAVTTEGEQPRSVLKKAVVR